MIGDSAIAETSIASPPAVTLADGGKLAAESVIPVRLATESEPPKRFGATDEEPS